LDIVSICPFIGGALVWEAQPRQYSLTVLVKGTFELAPGEVVVAPEQEDLCEERHWDNNALASLYWPGDFAPLKRRVDVMLVGHAYAPGGRSATTLTASLRVGELFKSVQVTGDRVYAPNAARSLEPTSPSPFRQMPLRYERAALSADNPVGIDPRAPPVLSMPAAANLERADGRGVPCFGPIAPSWRTRRRLVDDAALFWAYGVARARTPGAPPLGPAPPRFDFSFFNAAPAELQLDMLRPGTPIVLENLDPDHARLETRLSAFRPQVFRVPPQHVDKGRVEEIILRCDSLWIDTDRGVAVMTWRGLADLGDGAEERVGRLVIAADPGGKKLRWDRVAKRAGENPTATLRLDASAASSARQPSAGDVESVPDPLGVRYDALKSQRPEDAVQPPRDAGGRVGRAETPPNPPTKVGGWAPPAAPVQIHDEPSELSAPSSAPTEPLPPDRAAAPRVLVPPPSRPRVGAPVVREGATVVLPGVAPRRPAPPRPAAGSAAKGRAKTLVSPVIAGGSAPRPPAQPPARPPMSMEPANPLREDLSIERYATIAAELARRGADRAAVLRAHDLVEVSWHVVDQHFRDALADEKERGESALADAFDAAYLSAEERRRPPVGVAEYARIQVALERGEVGRVLAGLALELGDLMRLQRVWGKRLAVSPGLAADLARAVEAARRVAE
jgi:hypothetical protein